jgi:hypothetical protein
MYIAYSCSLFSILNNFQTIIQHFPKHYSIIVMGDFNIDILKENNLRIRSITFIRSVLANCKFDPYT